MGSVGGMGMGGPRAGPQFPPALQKWLQRLFSDQSTKPGDPNHVDPKTTHTYLRYWVQQWVKSGELWQCDWEAFPLPTPQEILANVAPGSKSKSAGSGFSGPGSQAAAKR